jgi:hypothetical protein
MSLFNIVHLLDVVSNYFCHLAQKHPGLEIAHEMPKRSTGESLFFQVAGQASGQNVVGSIQDLFYKADR